MADENVQPPQEAAVSGQSGHYRHVKRGQKRADTLIDGSAHRVRDWMLRVKRFAGDTEHSLNELAYPWNAQLRAALESVEGTRVEGYRAEHFESRRDDSTDNSIEAVGLQYANRIKAISVAGEPVWYPKVSSEGPISTAAGYNGSAYAVNRPQGDRDWSLTLVVTHPTIEGGPTPDEQGQIWLDHWSPSRSGWALSERHTATSLVLTITGNGQVGQKTTIDMTARSSIAPSRLKLTITVTNPQPAAE